MAKNVPKLNTQILRIERSTKCKLKFIHIMMKIYNLYFNLKYIDTSRFPRWHSSKEAAYQSRKWKRHGFDPWIGKIPWKRAWQPTTVFLPGKSLGQGVWQATVHGLTKSRTQLSTHTETHHNKLQNIKNKGKIPKCYL